MAREEYAAHHGFDDYLGMHMALLRAPPDVAAHHMGVLWGTAADTPDAPVHWQIDVAASSNDSEPAP